MVQFLFRFRIVGGCTASFTAVGIPRWPEPTSRFSHFPPAPTSSGRGNCRWNRLVNSNKMQQNVAKTGWELTKVARIGRSRSVYGQKRARSVYGQKRVEGGVGRSREPKLSVCCLRTSAHPFLAKNRPGAPVFGHCPSFICTRYFFCSTWYSDGHVLGCFLLVQG